MREARARFAELLDAAEQGNITVITRHGRSTAAIIPAALLDQLGQPGPALAAAVAGLRGALGALEPLLSQPETPPVAQRSPYQSRPGRAVLVAVSLAALRGPVHGVVELPLRLFWSAPDRTFDLDRPSMLLALYESVLREASRAEDLTSYLNGATLAAIWPELYLPKGVRLAWEEQHPALRAARMAAA